MSLLKFQPSWVVSVLIWQESWGADLPDIPGTIIGKTLLLEIDPRQYAMEVE